MLRGNNIDQPEHYASPEQLRIGLYVYVDLPWFRHPFTLNSFRISSDEQIRNLRALKESRFRYDPARSEIPADAAMPEAADAPIESVGTDVADRMPAPAREVPSVDDLSATERRIRHLQEHRAVVARTEKSFVKAAGVVRRLNRNLLRQPKESLDEMHGLVDQMVTVFIERPEVTLQVMGENCGGEEAYHHSLNVSILCMLLVKSLGLTHEQAGMLGAGAMLHDIGALEIPDYIMRKSPDEQTSAEREMRAMHVEYGARLGRRLHLAPELLTIIEQHHELADGTGYPHGLTLPQIAPLARIVSLVNFYDNLCNPADFGRAMTPHEALAYIFARLKSKFDVEILQILIRSLGVYPPGSIVRLSNDAFGMVVSINPHKTLRPWVLVHDAAVPRDAATVLNLEAEEDISISRAIRPALLPPQIHAYLSPRKRITYFFDGGLPIEGGAK